MHWLYITHVVKLSVFSQPAEQEVYLFISRTKVDMFMQSHTGLGLRDVCLKVSSKSASNRALQSVLGSVCSCLCESLQCTPTYWVRGNSCLGKMDGNLEGQKAAMFLFCNKCIVTSWLPGVYLTEEIRLLISSTETQL